MPWPSAPLAELCDIKIGRTPPRADREFWGSGYPWLSIADMNQGRDLVRTKEEITDLAASQVMGAPTEPGTVLLSFKLSVGKVGIARRRLYTNEAIASLPIRARDRISPEFLYWALRSMDFSNETDRAAMGATLNKAKLRSVRVPVPPMEEQRRIADILDRADALRAKRREALALLDDLTQSIFLDMFGDPDQNPRGWPIRSLAELVAQNDRINYGVLQPGGEFPGGVGLVRVGDLINGGIQHSSLKHIDPAVERSYKRSRLVGNEVLVSCVGSIGVVAIASQDDVGLNIARAVSRVPIESPSMREYVAAHLRTPAVQRYFTRELRTVAQPTLNVKQLSETRIMQPPVKAIEKFVVAGETLAPCRSSISASADHLDIMFESLQQRAFVGEL